MPTLLLPLEGHGPHCPGGGSFALPLLDSLLVLAVVVAVLVAVHLWRQGRLSWPGLAVRRSPEDDAKQILADRFARGDISTDEFLERSSVLNWTPGSDPTPVRRHRHKRR